MYTNLNIKLVDTINEKINFFCKICRFPLRSQKDFAYNKSHECCHECYLTYAEARRKEWKDGWRPDKETIEEYIYKRKNLLLQQEKK